MKIILTSAELEEILLDTVKSKYSNAFREAADVGYNAKIEISSDVKIRSLNEGLDIEFWVSETHEPVN